MKVVTLHKEQLRRAAIDLLALARETGYEPTLLVGIEQAGAIIAECMAASGDVNARMLTLHVQRPGTAGKKRSNLLAAVLRHAPRRARDALRNLEQAYLKRRRARPREVSLDPAMRRELDSAAGRGHRLLIVDDAVDSGATLAAASRYLKSLLPEAEVRSAALTVTRREPELRPDYVLFAPVLLRLPTSLDYRR